MKVFVYWNLHKKCFSVKALSGPDKGKVVQHVETLRLTYCTFKVSEAGRQRVLRERKKYVHAGVVGYTGFTVLGLEGHARAVTYNPFKGPQFTERGSGLPVTEATVCDLGVETIPHPSGYRSTHWERKPLISVWLD